MKKKIPIMPRNGMYLNYYYCSDEDARRFARIFRETWLQLPLSARRAMLKDWRAFKTGFASLAANEETRAAIAGMPVPVIAIDAYIPDDRDFEFPLGVFRGKFGRGLHFWDYPVETMPDEVLSSLIAHELAHAYLKASGEVEEIAAEDMSNEAADFFGGKSGWEEYRVYEVMEDWYFSDDEISVWCNENRAATDARLAELRANE